MAYMDHIMTCNRHDLSRYVPFAVGDQAVGWVRRDRVALLISASADLSLSQDTLVLNPRWANPADRTAKIDEICQNLAADLPAPRRERYAVRRDWGQPIVMEVDRAFASLFGIRAFGIHVNGLVQRPDGCWLWVARRAMDRLIAPGKLDNIIAGGQPSHLQLHENLQKEAAEEADVPADLARQAIPVGAIRYCMEDEWGLKPDTMFCFDLHLPTDFMPRNTDGEIQSFELMPILAVAERVNNSDDFKFNVNLVILDLLIRRGLLHPDQHPDYAQLVTLLRGQLPPLSWSGYNSGA